MRSVRSPGSRKGVPSPLDSRIGAVLQAELEQEIARMYPKAEKNTEVSPNHGEHRAHASVFLRYTLRTTSRENKDERLVEFGVGTE